LCTEADLYEAALRSGEVADARTALSTEHLDVAAEVYYRRASVTEAAATLRIPPRAVESRTVYALRALRPARQERGITP
jgi:RNA polymerase sigma-70 factor, ECF subfamily